MECAYYFEIVGGRHMECAYYFEILGGRHMECAYYFESQSIIWTPNLIVPSNPPTQHPHPTRQVPRESIAPGILFRTDDASSCNR
jgi:hypothetical protein